jgi:hypothetical protein
MVELLKTVVSWPGLVLVLVVFGFAPGFCLRLIVLTYPRSDPRRAELIAELYAVPRIKRPLWVAEQLEVALFEGFGQRVSAAIRTVGERQVHNGGSLRRLLRLSAVAAVVVSSLVASMWWLLAKGTRGAEIASVLGLPIAILSLLMAVVTAVRPTVRRRKAAKSRTDPQR